MRVIAGEYRSRSLLSPHGMRTRPTSDRLRETLFNVLASRGLLDGCIFADLFAGSGAVGLEALSRGAAHCYFVENAKSAVGAIKSNLQRLGVPSDRATLLESSILQSFKKWPRPCDVIFIDPPYEDADAYAESLAALGADTNGTILKLTGLVVVEHARPALLADSYGRLRRTRVLEQGDAALSFFA